MLTDMAPTATAAGQFYGTQMQTMGIANLAPHIQKPVSIKRGVSVSFSLSGIQFLMDFVFRVIATSEKSISSRDWKL